MLYLGKITDPKDLVNKEYVDNINTSIQAELDTKANTDGAYDNMTVGNAEQLVSTVMVNDKVPYLYRTSGGSADIGNREYDTLVGGTVAWNQYAGVPSTRTVNDVTLTNNGDGTATLNGEASAQTRFLVATVAGINGHKIFIKGSPSGGSTATYCMVDNQQSANQYDFGDGKIFNVVHSRSEVYIQVANGYTATNLVFTPQVFDLTQMFGTTIADYIYGLEQANAGAGVAWFKALFPEDYYPYNAGTLLSVSGVSAHQMTGFNQWDEEWELGRYVNGVKDPKNDQIRCVNRIPVLPGTTYYFKVGSGNATLQFLDANGNYISQEYKANAEFNTPSTAAYLVFTMNTAYGTTYNHDICINLSWSGYRNGEYEPYVLHSYPLDSDLTLRGVPQLDADNNLYYDGDTYEADGTVTRKYGVVDLGTLTFSGGYGVFNAPLTTKTNANGLCGMFRRIPTTSTVTAADYTVQMRGNTAYFIIRSINTVSDFRAAVNGQILVYELATPTTETADAFQSPQIVDDFGTERYVVTAQSGVEVPVGHNTDYPANLRDKLQHLPDLAESDGTYLIQQTDNEMALTAYVAPRGVPDAPTTDGTYVLKAVVADGTATYSWVSE